MVRVQNNARAIGRICELMVGYIVTNEKKYILSKIRQSDDDQAI